MSGDGPIICYNPPCKHLDRIPSLDWPNGPSNDNLVSGGNDPIKKKNLKNASIFIGAQRFKTLLELTISDVNSFGRDESVYKSRNLLE